MGETSKLSPKNLREESFYMRPETEEIKKQKTKNKNVLEEIKNQRTNQ